MARKVEIVCDRCGKELRCYDIKLVSARIDIWGVGVRRSDFAQRLDFCEKCYAGFIDYLEGDNSKNEG